MDGARIGVDESGKGDYFGPLVIAACLVGPQHEDALAGVKDSKTLSDKRALELAAVIRENCPHSVAALMPPKYNDAHAKMKNLNRILERGHSRVIENVLAVEACGLVISDQFANPAGLKRVLGEKGQKVELVSMVRAERDLAVAAASVLARAEFLIRLRELGEEAGMELPKGAGPPVLAAGRKLVQLLGKEQLGQYAKLHFKTTQQL